MLELSGLPKVIGHKQATKPRIYHGFLAFSVKKLLATHLVEIRGLLDVEYAELTYDERILPPDRRSRPCTPA